MRVKSQNQKKKEKEGIQNVCYYYFAAVLTLGIVGFKLGFKHNLPFTGVLSLVLTALSGICIAFILSTVISNALTKETSREKDFNEYEVLQYLVDNDIYQPDKYERIIEHNNKVCEYQKYNDSLWFGWKYYEGCEDILFVEYQ